jgi:hypothetical protein
MRSSTRRSISRAAVLGLLSTTPLIAGWAATDPAEEATSRSAPAAGADEVSELEPVHLAAFGELEPTWLEFAPAVDETLRTDDARVDPTEADAGLTAEQIAAIDTSGVTVTFLGDDEAPDGDVQPATYATADGDEISAERIHAFLDGRNAPMAELADEILEAGITHDVDPRVIVGIAIAESNAGERLPAGSHNAWGWGGSGRFGLAHWDSWDQALDTYAERLGALYDTDNVDRSFAQTYCPPNWQWWLDTVTWVIDEI